MSIKEDSKLALIDFENPHFVSGLATSRRQILDVREYCNTDTEPVRGIMQKQIPNSSQNSHLPVVHYIVPTPEHVMGVTKFFRNGVLQRSTGLATGSSEPTDIIVNSVKTWLKEISSPKDRLSLHRKKLLERRELLFNDYDKNQPSIEEINFLLDEIDEQIDLLEKNEKNIKGNRVTFETLHSAIEELGKSLEKTKHLRKIVD